MDSLIKFYLVYTKPRCGVPHHPRKFPVRLPVNSPGERTITASFNMKEVLPVLKLHINGLTVCVYDFINDFLDSSAPTHERTI